MQHAPHSVQRATHTHATHTMPHNAHHAPCPRHAQRRLAPRRTGSATGQGRVWRMQRRACLPHSRAMPRRHLLRNRNGRWRTCSAHCGVLRSTCRGCWPPLGTTTATRTRRARRRASLRRRRSGAGRPRRCSTSTPQRKRSAAQHDRGTDPGRSDRSWRRSAGRGGRSCRLGAALSRYAHYYERYANHEKAEKIALAKLPSIKQVRRSGRPLCFRRRALLRARSFAFRRSPPPPPPLFPLPRCPASRLHATGLERAGLADGRRRLARSRWAIGSVARDKSALATAAHCRT